MNEYNKERRLCLLRLKLCIVCKADVVPDKTRCQNCIEKVRIVDKKYRDKAKTNGICYRCCSRKVENGFSKCPVCSAKEKERKKRYREKTRNTREEQINIRKIERERKRKEILEKRRVELEIWRKKRLNRLICISIKPKRKTVEDIWTRKYVWHQMS